MNKRFTATIVFAIASLLTKGIGIITIPFFTRILSQEEMGVYTLYNSWWEIFYPIITLGFDSGGFNIAMMEFDKERDKYISSIITFTLISATFFDAIILLFVNKLTIFFSIPKILIFVMCIMFLVRPAYNYWMAKQRYESEYKKVGVVSFLSAFGAALTSIVFVLIFKKLNIGNLGTVRVITSEGIFILISFVILIICLAKGKSFINTKYWKFSLFTCVPLIFHTIAMHILSASDKVMIGYLVSKSAVGVYGIVYSISGLSLIVWNAINASLIPFMFESIDKSVEKEQKLNQIISILVGFYGIICVLISLCAPEILKILATKEYYTAVYLIPAISGGIFFTAFYNIFSNVLLFYKKTLNIMFSTIIAAVCNIILNYIFIKKYGYIAAAYTTLCSFLILALMQFVSMHIIRQHRKLFDSFKLWTIALITVFLCLFSAVLYKQTFIRYLIIGVFLIAICYLYFRNKDMLKSMLLKKNKVADNE